MSDEEDAEAPIVLEQGRELDEGETAELKGSLGSLVKRLTGRAWEVRVGRSVAKNPATLYKTSSETHSAGEVRYAAYVAEVYEILAHKKAGGGLMALHCFWVGKDGSAPKLTSARTFDPWMGEQLRPRPSSSRPQNEWEKEAGETPPLGLNQWLAMAAPTPAEIKKREQAKEAA